MEGTSDEVLYRMREQADAFESQTDRRDDKVNDGNNYKGVMSAADYKKRRLEVLEENDEDRDAKERAAKLGAAAAAVAADLKAASQDRTDREEREKQRKEKLQKELQQAADAEADEAAGDSSAAPKKKKKKKAPQGEAAGLSFDAEDDG